MNKDKKIEKVKIKKQRCCICFNDIYYGENTSSKFCWMRKKYLKNTVVCESCADDQNDDQADYIAGY